MATLQRALSTILLEDPALIEHLPRTQSARLDVLLDANGLQPMLYHALKSENREGTLSEKRNAAWKSSYLLALARAAAFGAARREINDLGVDLGIPVRMLRETHMAFRVHARPELRPLAEIEVQVPALRARDLYSALKSRRFFDVEPLVRPAAGRARPYLIGREGVVVKIQAGSSMERPAPWDAFPANAADFSRPIALAPEPTIILHAQHMARRCFCHSLALLHDLHVLLEKSKPAWDRLISLAAATASVSSVYLSLSLLRELLRNEIDAGFMREAEKFLGLPSPNADLLRSLCLSAVLQHPASARLSMYIQYSLETERLEAAPSV